MDLLGVTRTIDHAVYMVLNALAIILWRLDSALLGISLLSYRTQDWLTGPDGGLWRLLARLVGAEGIFGLTTWQVFLTLALALFGLSRIVRPFLRTRSVDLGRLLFFAAMAYVFITQGSEMMRQAESWRSQAGSYVYNALASGGPVDLDIPGGTTGDLIYPPQDLDGQIPIRGWEAVATSYFLATDAGELHAGVPPHDFRLAYCLYDPALPIDAQDEENAAGCSPRVAWDEWDLVSTQTITEVWGIPLPIDISLSLPVVEEHPENRQLGIRQAQAGVARLALGPVVSLFPIVEANVGLMLALAASFIYLSLPITLLFGFFLYTEPMATRLFLQFISVFLRTLILNGLIALFMLVLMGVAAGGSLMAYLGLVGVGLVGGVFLMRIAGDTMKETLSQSLGAIGGIWMGATTGVLGEGARRPAQAALGVAKLGVAGATLAAGGLGATGVMMPAFDVARSGAQDLRDRPPGRAEAGMKRHGRLPDPLARMVARDQASDGSLRPVVEAEAAVPLLAQWSPAPTSARRAEPIPWTAPLPSGDGGRQLPEGRAPAAGRTVEAWTEEVYRARERGQGRRQAAEAGRELLGEGLAREAERAMARHSKEEAMAVLRAVRQAAAEARGGAEAFFRADGSLSPGAMKAVRERLDEKTARAFSGRQGERDLAVLTAAGLKPRGLPGEGSAQEAEQAMARHSKEETAAVLRVARRAAAEARTRGGAEAFFRADGSLSPEAMKAVRERLDEKTARAFSGRQGERDLAVLTAAGLNPRREASPEEFRRATAAARGWRGAGAAGRAVPRALGLDPAAAGEHFAGLNRFARLSEQAGLTTEQRQQLLKEVQQEGKVSANLRLEIKASLRRQKGKAAGLNVDDVVASAQALPQTLRGPVAVCLPGGQMRKGTAAGRSSSAVRKPVGGERKRSQRGGAHETSLEFVVPFDADHGLAGSGRASGGGPGSDGDRHGDSYANANCDGDGHFDADGDRHGDGHPGLRRRPGAER